MVEVGQFYGIPLEECFCPFCKDKHLHKFIDEFQLLHICEMYQEQRNELYPKILITYPSGFLP